MEFVDGNNEVRSHRTVHLDAEDSHAAAAIRFAAATCDALAAVHVRLHRAIVSDGNAKIIRADFDNFNSQFMTEHTRILKEGLLAGVRMQVRTTDTDAMNANQSFARTGAGRLRNVVCEELAGLLEDDLLHGIG